MRFTHLHLENWRNFSNVSVDLQERAFVVGPNAAGKSNLLDAFRFLRDVAAPEGGLQRAAAERGGADTIRFLGATSDAAITVRVEMEDDGGAWGYYLAFKAEEGAAALTKEGVTRNGKVLVARSEKKDPDRGDPLLLRQTSLEQVAANRSFRDVAEFLSQIVYQHPTPEFIRNRVRVNSQSPDPFGGHLVDRVVRTPQTVLAKRMQRINVILRAALPQLDRIDVEEFPDRPPHLWVRFKNWRSTAGAQNEQQLSDGTLRLFGFVWALLDGEGPLLLEEPELSLHPGVVRHLAALAHIESHRQTIISTHSLDLLADEGIGLDEVLLLQPTSEGTQVSRASDDAQIRALLEGGLSIGDAVLPSTAPPRSIDMMRAGRES